MFNKSLFVIAYNNKEWHTVASLMLSLEAEYIVGNIDSSGKMYKYLIKFIPMECLKIMKEQTIFKYEHKVIDFWIESIKKGVDTKYTAATSENKIIFISNTEPLRKVYDR